jgi:hypothetical protein
MSTEKLDPMLGYGVGVSPHSGYFRLRPAGALWCVWLPVGLLAMVLALAGCRRYNYVAGTDLNRVQIAAVVLSVHVGPFAGPIHSTGGFRESFYRWLLPIPSVAMVAGWLPFVLVRRPVKWAWAAAAWCGNVAGAVAWYGAALLSLAFWLS